VNAGRIKVLMYKKGKNTKPELRGINTSRSTGKGWRSFVGKARLLSTK